MAQAGDVGKMLYELVDRDGQTRLTWGLTYLFGRAECPGCGSVFGIGEEYEAANAPTIARSGGRVECTQKAGG